MLVCLQLYVKLTGVYQFCCGIFACACDATRDRNTHTSIEILLGSMKSARREMAYWPTPADVNEAPMPLTELDQQLGR
jgi:hypothetical protein